MHIGVIPARAGSKRIPGKNRQMLDGKELWRIAFENSLKTMDRTYINTDDEEIKTFFTDAIIYHRPSEFTDGMSYRIDDVLLEMVKTMNFNTSDIIHLIPPTSPFLSLETIKTGKQFFTDFSGVDSIQSVIKINNTYHEYSQRKLNYHGFIEFANKELRDKHFNSQRKPDRYAFAGYIAFRVGSLLRHRNIWGEDSYPIFVNPMEAADIDTKEDLKNARHFISAGVAI